MISYKIIVNFFFLHVLFVCQHCLGMNDNYNEFRKDYSYPNYLSSQDLLFQCLNNQVPKLNPEKVIAAIISGKTLQASIKFPDYFIVEYDKENKYHNRITKKYSIIADHEIIIKKQPLFFVGIHNNVYILKKLIPISKNTKKK